MSRHDDMSSLGRWGRQVVVGLTVLLLALVIGSTSTIAAALALPDQNLVMITDADCSHATPHHQHDGDHEHEISCSEPGHCATAVLVSSSTVAAAPVEVFGRPLRPRACADSRPDLIERPPIR
jgi:hypothetical protein